jgi:general secretion pathway protein A
MLARLMYARHFGLQQEPFSIAPDPRFLYMSERHREALAHLLYGLQSGGGFVLLTGEIGAGKTTVCRAFLEQIPPHCQVAYVFNPQLSAEELLATVCQEFGVAVPEGSSRKAHIDALNAHLLRAHAEGRRCVLIVDEAQALEVPVLEQLRLLTNLETSQHKLLQIILIGQPELQAMLARPELEQLAQRVIARTHLGPLDEADTRAYVAHRLAVAGHPGVLPFTASALRTLHRRSGGVPRRINLLADRALLGAYASGQAQVDKRVLEQAAAEVQGRGGAAVRGGGVRPGPAAVMGAAACLVLLAAAVAAWVALVPTSVADMPATAAVGSATSGAVAGDARAPLPASNDTAVPAGLPTFAPVAPSAPPVLTQALPPSLPDDGLALLRELGALWNTAVPAGCVAAAAGASAAPSDLSCLPARPLTLATITALDRPGLVTLQTAQARPWPALLLALDAEHATLRAGGQTYRLPRALFAAAWRGDYATWWLGRDSRPAALDAALAQAMPGTSGSLAARLVAFQRSQGLVADGVPGALTLMQLNRALGVPEPRLAPAGLVGAVRPG